MSTGPMSRWFWISAFGVFMALGACAPGENGADESAPGRDGATDVASGGSDVIAPPNVDPSQSRFLDTCLDYDGDGFGVNCSRGPDCDDRDASVTNECYRCARPATGCACPTEGARRPCDAVTDSDLPAPDGTCHLGERVCQTGHWSRCRALDGSMHTIVPPTSCGSSCNPECRTTIVCPTAADLAGRGTGVVIGTDPPPGFCPVGSGPGGIRLPAGSGGTGGGPTGCGLGTCGGVCCSPGTTCYSYTDTAVYPPFCMAGGRTSPPPAVVSSCGTTCAVGETPCGFPPDVSCCPAGRNCVNSRCIAPQARCVNNSQCPPGQYCNTAIGNCVVRDPGSCNCQADPNQQACLNSIVAQGGQVIDNIFRTPSGGDARTLRFATYVRGLEASPSGCRTGVSSSSTGLCPGCTPTICTSYQCIGSPVDFPTLSSYTNFLDWRWTQHVRYNDLGAGVVDGTGGFYYPWRGRIMDLGAPANRVALFPITDHTTDSCLEPFEYTVWLSDNPNATTIAPTNAPDPAQWNRATLTQIFTQGWTRNPRSIGNPMDTSDVTSLAFGDAVADAMVSVWAVTCGYSFRYASIVAGNDGNPTGSCTFHSSEDELDAVAGLTISGDSLAIYHRIPFGGSAGPDSLTFSTQVRTADVYFLFDTTGSMGGELANLRTGLTTGTFVAGCSGGILGGIRCIIPDAWFGVGFFDDFPVNPYGSAGIDSVYRNTLDITSSLPAVTAAIGALGIHFGNDGPESHVPALWATASGGGLGRFLPARGACPAGGVGYPCFRRGTIPIVMMFTDAQYHNGPGDSYLYNDALLGGGGAITYPAAVAVAGNDTQATARVLAEATSFLGTGTTLGTANNRNAPCAFSNAGDVVYRVNLTATRSIHLDTYGSAFDTTLYVYRSDGVLMGCNDDAGGTWQSELNLTLGAGTYYIWVDGYGAAVGRYTFRYGIPTGGAFVSPRFPDAVNALNAIGAKVVVVNSCGGQAWCTPDNRNHGIALANATGSLISGGAPAVYSIPSDGSGLGAAVINGVRDLANYSRMDVTAIAIDNPATPGVDERCFVRNPAGTAPGTVRLSNPAIGESAPYAATRCVDPPGSVGGIPVVARQCLPGTNVNFRAEFVNNCVMSTAVDQTFTFDIVTYGNGTYELGRVPVTIVVPANLYPASGTFTYDVDATTSCAVGDQPQWTQLQYVATTPAGTSVRIEIQTAATLAGLATAPVVLLGIQPPATSPLDIGAALLSAMQSGRLPFIRIRFTLNSNAARDQTPTLSGYRVLFNCVAGT